jgi:hypothetical protein
MTDDKGRKLKLDRAIQDKIGRELRAMYAELLLTAPLHAIDEVQSSRERLQEALLAMRAAQSPNGARARSRPPSIGVGGELKVQNG